MTTRKGNVDVESGVFFTVIGVIALLLSTRYPFGSAARMGPGFFPVILSVIMTGLGIAILISGLRTKKPVFPEAFDMKSLGAVTLSIVLFGVLLLRAGLLITVPLSVFVASFAQPRVNWRKTLVIALAITAFCWLVFIAGLGLRIPVLPRI